MRRIMTMAAAMLAATIASAQSTTINNEMVEGKTVRRIVFDREKIEVTLSDGSTMTDVKNMRAKIDKDAGISAPATGGSGKEPTAVYDLQGRRMAVGSSVSRPKTVFVKRKNGRTTKHIGK